MAEKDEDREEAVVAEKTSPKVSAMPFLIVAVLVLIAAGILFYLMDFSSKRTAEVLQVPAVSVHSAQNASNACIADVVWANEAPIAEWPKETLAPHEASAHVKACADMHLRWAGDTLVIHDLYADGHECVKEPEAACPDGQLEEFVVNDSDNAAPAWHAWAHRNEP